jgi:hypothetical protein
MLWWTEIADLKRRLGDIQDELRKEQGKASRLAGFIGRLQQFGISSTGEAPRRAFAEALIDSVGTLLKTDLVILFQRDSASSDFLPTAARGAAPDILTKARIRTGESVLGKAAQEMKTILNNTTTGGEGTFFTAPYLLVPLISQASCTGLLLFAKPREGSFTPEAQELASLFARQAALTFEDHAKHEEFNRLGSEAVSALAQAIEAKDPSTHRHSDRTRALVRAFAQEIPLPEMLVKEIEYGAFLHDVGKIGIEESLLRKTDKLTPREYDIMKTHPAIGQRILQPIPFLKQVGAIVLYHQEWYNGTGYPEGLAGEEIPLGARIVQIIDAWDAMTSDRPYRKAMTKTAAIAELRRQEGTQFDPKLVELFLRVLERLEREGVPTTEQKVGAAVPA